MRKTMPPNDDKAPLLGSWKAWYLLVVVVLVACIGAFFWFTKHFS